MQGFYPLIPGILDVVDFSETSVGATVNVQMTPAEGEIWILLAANAFHDDAAGRNCYWLISDGVTELTLSNHLALAANSFVPFYGDGYALTTAIPLVLNHTTTVTWRVVNLAAAQEAHIYAVIYKCRGLESWNNV